MILTGLFILLAGTQASFAQTVNTLGTGAAPGVRTEAPVEIMNRDDHAK